MTPSTPSPAWEQVKQVWMFDSERRYYDAELVDAARAADASQIEKLRDERDEARSQASILSTAKEEIIVALSAQVERHANQARDISTWLSEAGCPAMPIPEGVKWLLHRAEAAEDQVAQLKQEKDALVESLSRSNDTTEKAIRRMEAAESELAQLRQQAARYENAQCITCGADLDRQQLTEKEQA